MNVSIEHLVEQAQAGNHAAASELVAQFYERIYAFLRRLAGQDEDAADLTQKTFGKVWLALPSYAGRSSFSTWLHGIARHVYLDWRRQRNSLQPQTEEWWAACAASDRSPFEQAAELDLAGHLYRAVEQLDEDTRQTVHLHYYQGLTLAETAEVLGIATSTVKYRLREAIEFLRSRTAEGTLRVH